MEREIESFVIEEAVGFAINRASIEMRKKLTYIFKKEGYDITPEEFSILSQLWEEDGLLQSVINDKTLKDKTTVTRLLERLKTKGLIEKRIEEADRRNYRIHLTEKGMAIKYNIIPIVIKLLDMASHNIDGEDLRITIKTLKEIVKNLNAEDNQ
ncbi:DNA-binding MarR family transcriptional regulator [Anaerosolibacter carboniphilus]|uniref:DNA-binding MarR family transcriptional regulator n=1 Tax=Anaerosolibacter carboniphilus TaxID=1417629 RepID=A0A841KTB5_9FIRM|nr:MarR family transcriptional regulator [Anaerosolibacter carboniphilus]MBB6215398.1 DNA-binding MarR family transcriptional regulator [Anaerosolibacter carboniphilus]